MSIAKLAAGAGHSWRLNSMSLMSLFLPRVASVANVAYTATDLHNMYVASVVHYINRVLAIEAP